MSIQYNLYINELKEYFTLNKISFRKKYNLFYNNLDDLIDIELEDKFKKYDVQLLLKYKDDINIQRLYKCIKNEQEQVAIKFDNILSNLNLLNEILIKLKEEPQESLIKAKKILKTININIYDLINEEYHKETSYKLLIKDLNKNPHRKFRLAIAKKHKLLKNFLKRC